LQVLVDQLDEIRARIGPPVRVQWCTLLVSDKCAKASLSHASVTYLISRYPPQSNEL
jgi:hypothetical protein